MHDRIKNIIEQALVSFGVPKDMVAVSVEHTADFRFGDYTTNVAMILVKSMGATVKDPFELAQNIVKKIQSELTLAKSISIEKVEAVRPGFINFHLSKSACIEAVEEAHEKKVWYGKSTKLWNKKIIIEHTNFNLFKPFHIGHLVNNAVGESLSRLFEFQDAKLTRASYGSDIGLPVAKAVWGIMQYKGEFADNSSMKTHIDFIGRAYAHGSKMFDEQEESKKEIQEINKKIYLKNDPVVNEIYAWGRDISMKYTQEIHALLGTHMDYNFWESDVADEGVKIVMEGLEKGIFERSEGAIIFPGEKYGLHSRVFITSQGLPTYEAKELGLTKKKFELHDFDRSIVVTDNEQKDYFKVVIKALELMYPEIASRTQHISHGTLRLESGKMSSRKGGVIMGESLLNDTKTAIASKMSECSDMSEAEKNEIVLKVAIAAIKYSILRQSIGKDIVFDPEKSISFEGDSGPYLQYTFVRTKSVLAKALKDGVSSSVHDDADKKTKNNHKNDSIESPVFLLERLLVRFPEIVQRAATDYAPSTIATYLTHLAGEFNSFYAHTKIVDKKDETSPYKIALTEAVGIVLKNGMYLLGIDAPERM